MKKLAQKLGGYTIACFFLVSCSSAPQGDLYMNSRNSLYVNTQNSMFIPSFLSRLGKGDRHVGWALSYYKSWERDYQPRYLFLAEDHIYSAINEFARLQSDTSPRINEFYIVRERRVRGCRFLAELQFSAVNHGFTLRNSAPAMCIF